MQDEGLTSARGGLNPPAKPYHYQTKSFTWLLQVNLPLIGNGGGRGEGVLRKGDGNGAGIGFKCWRGGGCLRRGGVGIRIDGEVLSEGGAGRDAGGDLSGGTGGGRLRVTGGEGVVHCVESASNLQILTVMISAPTQAPP